MRVPDPIKYVCRDWRPFFEAFAPYVDKPAVHYHLKEARRLVVQIREATSKLRQLRKSLQHHAAEIWKLSENAESRRSP